MAYSDLISKSALDDFSHVATQHKEVIIYVTLIKQSDWSVKLLGLVTKLE